MALSREGAGWALGPEAFLGPCCVGHDARGETGAREAGEEERSMVKAMWMAGKRQDRGGLRKGAIWDIFRKRCL